MKEYGRSRKIKEGGRNMGKRRIVEERRKEREKWKRK